MPAQADAAVRATSLLTVHAGQSAWAIPSAAITSVERLVAGAETDAPDALTLLGMARADAETSRRVMVVHAAGEHARVLVCGAIALTETAPEDLVPLPTELATTAPLVSHVALVSGKAALFVVSPERLLRASRELAALSTPNDEDADRGSSC